MERDEFVLWIERVQHLDCFSSEGLFELLDEVVVPLAVDLVDEEIWISVQLYLLG